MNSVLKKLNLASLLIITLYPAYSLHPKIFLEKHKKIKFKQISIRGHVPFQQSVYSICQDTNGFMWFGTHDGLYRYDGYRFYIYRHDPLDSTSLSNNSVEMIFEDSKKNLWIGTDNGYLDLYDRLNDCFCHYKIAPHINDFSIRTIIENGNGNLLLGTEQGLILFNTINGDHRHYLRNKIQYNIFSIIKDHQGNLWIGTNNGLFLYNKSRDILLHYSHDKENAISNNNVYSIIEDNQKNIWIGTFGGGVNLFNIKKGRFIQYRYNINNIKSLSNDYVRALYKDSKNNLWIATIDGLNLFNKTDSSFIRIKDTNVNGNSYLSIFEDATGNLWFGNYAGGAKYIPFKEQAFKQYSFNKKHYPVLAILKDHAGKVWVGTDGEGLYCFNRGKRTIAHYTHNDFNNNSISSNIVLSIIESKRGGFWIGTYHGGLDYLKKDQKTFIHYKKRPDDSTSISDNTIWNIFEDKNLNLWLATEGGYLNFFNRSQGIFYHLDNKNNNIGSSDVRITYEDKKGNLWIGTVGGGLNVLTKEKRKTIVDYSSLKQVVFKQYLNHENIKNSISSNRIFSILEGKEGTLWIGTFGGGLNQFNPQTQSFSAYTEKDGLCNDNIYGILEDEDGELWISTNNGLSNFNPRNKKFRNYYVRHGLLSNQFNKGAYFKGSDGEMFFGGPQGFISFYPRKVKQILSPSPIVITDFWINKIQKNKEEEENSIYKKYLKKTGIITLKGKHTFAVEFAVLDYVAPEQNQYAYFLEGYENQWNYVGTTHTATYTNIPSGNYIFHVKGANSRGVWNTTGASVDIKIVTPLVKTWWVRILEIITILAVAITASAKIYLKRVHNVEKHYEELEGLLKQKTKIPQETFSLSRNKILEQVLIPDRNELIIISAKDIFYIESQEHYSLIVTEKNSYLVSQKISEWEKHLDPKLFFRIHRSFIVNIAHIHKIKSSSTGISTVIMKNNKELPLSRRRINEFKKFFTPGL